MKEALEQLQRIVTQVPQPLLSISEADAESLLPSRPWSRKQILGHLIDSAANNHQRFVRAQIGSELVFPGYEQDQWVSIQAYQEESWESLVRLWSAYNEHLLHITLRIPADRLETSCTIGQNAPVTLAFLFVDYVRHLHHHLAQILGE